MSLNADVIWEFRPTAGDNANGGGFKEGASGTDYSQQNAAQVAYTDLIIDVVDDTQVTSVLTPFTSAHVGNIINITGGAGFTTGRYEVTAVAAAIATLDRVVGTNGSTGGTGNLGGALDYFTDSFFDNSISASGNGNFGTRIHVKNTGTMTFDDILSAANCRGLSTRQGFIRGYKTTRGDNPSGSDRPLIDLVANQWDWDANCNTINIEYLRFTTTSTRGMSIPLLSSGINCKFSNTSGNGSKYAVLIGSNGVAPSSGSALINCEVTNPSGLGVGLATQAYVSGLYFISGCWIHDCDTGITRHGTNTGRLYMSDTIIQACATTGVTGTSITLALVKNCTFYGASTPAGTGINSLGAVDACIWTNNIFYGWTTGVTATTQAESLVADYNNFFNNTTDRTNITAGAHDTALDPQFTAPGSNDFGVGANMKAIGFPSLIGVASGTTSFVDLGAAQSESASGGGGGQRTRGILPFYAVKGS